MSYTETRLIEKWEFVKGYEGLYTVSNLGRVYSMSRYIHGVKNRWGSSHSKYVHGCIVKIGDNGNGYKTVKLSKDGKMSTHYVHRLAYTSFKGDIPKDLVIDHINNNKEDNSLSNLQVLTQRKNAEKATLKLSSTTPYTGVYKVKGYNRFSARIRVGKERIHLGYFGTPEEANIAYQNKLNSVLCQ